jgi:hypothetical protein
MFLYANSQTECRRLLLSAQPFMDGGFSLTKIRMQKNICNFTTPLKPHNIGTHLKSIETSFQVVPLYLKSVLPLLGELVFKGFKPQLLLKFVSGFQW